MSNFMIAFLLSVGSSVWIYNKVYQRTGGNTSNTLVTAGMAFVAVFIITFSLLAILT